MRPAVFPALYSEERVNAGAVRATIPLPWRWQRKRPLLRVRVRFEAFLALYSVILYWVRGFSCVLDNPGLNYIVEVSGCRCGGVHRAPRGRRSPRAAQPCRLSGGTDNQHKQESRGGLLDRQEPFAPHVLRPEPS